VYFDQDGYLTSRFGIKAVPAIVRQKGKALEVAETPVEELKP
jgi:conjugal transfer pilus assembly protein TraW